MRENAQFARKTRFLAQKSHKNIQNSWENVTSDSLLDAKPLQLLPSAIVLQKNFPVNHYYHPPLQLITPFMGTRCAPTGPLQVPRIQAPAGLQKNIPAN